MPSKLLPIGVEHGKMELRTIVNETASIYYHKRGLKEGEIGIREGCAEPLSMAIDGDRWYRHVLPGMSVLHPKLLRTLLKLKTVASSLQLSAKNLPPINELRCAFHFKAICIQINASYHTDIDMNKWVHFSFVACTESNNLRKARPQHRLFINREITNVIFSLVACTVLL